MVLEAKVQDQGARLVRFWCDLSFWPTEGCCPAVLPHAFPQLIQFFLRWKLLRKDLDRILEQKVNTEHIDNSRGQRNMRKHNLFLENRSKFVYLQRREKRKKEWQEQLETGRGWIREIPMSQESVYGAIYLSTEIQIQISVPSHLRIRATCSPLMDRP